MTVSEFGDVILVPFPFTDKSQTKRRPAAVVSSTAYHHARTDVVILAITSQLRSVLAFGEMPVRQWREAGLLRPSVTKPVLATLEQRRVIRALGKMQREDRLALRELLRILLG